MTVPRRTAPWVVLIFAALLGSCAPRRTAPPANTGYPEVPAPVAAPAAAFADDALRGRRILLDPGHGGVFRGVVGRDGLDEATVNLDVALRLRDLLAVRACAGANRVVLSRGEIVAIGGSFRLDEILRETGCELVEVGTTNRTRPQDYREALRPGAVVLKVHRSNFVQQGFVEEVALRELAELCRAAGHVLIYDAGSGQLADLSGVGLTGHRTLQEDLADGPDLVTCSGDKLLGGGQAGLVLGRSDLIARLRDHPLRRALRVDKTTLAALDGTLTLYLEGTHLQDVPTLAFLERTEAELERLAHVLLASLADAAPAGWHGSVVTGLAQVGGGCSADATLPTRLVQWRAPREELERCHRRLRGGDPAVLVRIGQEGLAVDLRALRDDELPLVAAAVAAAWNHLAPNDGEAT